MKRFKVSHTKMNVCPIPFKYIYIRRSQIQDLETGNVGEGFDLYKFSAADQAARAALQQLNLQAEVDDIVSSLLQEDVNSSSPLVVDRPRTNDHILNTPLADISLFLLVREPLRGRLSRRNGSSGASAIGSGH